MVLLPDPLAPTRAVTLPAGTRNVKSRRTVTLGRVGYLKVTLSKEMSRALESNDSPSVEKGSISDERSISWNNCAAAAPARLKSIRYGAIVVRPLDAIMIDMSTLPEVRECFHLRLLDGLT